MEMGSGCGLSGACPFWPDIRKLAVCRIRRMGQRWTLGTSVRLVWPFLAVLLPGDFHTDRFQCGAHDTLFDWPDAMATEVYGPGNRRFVCPAYLSGQPIDTFLQSGYRPRDDQCRCSPCGEPVVRILVFQRPDARRGRLFFQSNSAELADDCSGRCVPALGRCAGPVDPVL